MGITRNETTNSQTETDIKWKKIEKNKVKKNPFTPDQMVSQFFTHINAIVNKNKQKVEDDMMKLMR